MTNEQIATYVFLGILIVIYGLVQRSIGRDQGYKQCLQDMIKIDYELFFSFISKAKEELNKDLDLHL